MNSLFPTKERAPQPAWNRDERPDEYGGISGFYSIGSRRIYVSGVILGINILIFVAVLFTGSTRRRCVTTSAAEVGRKLWLRDRYAGRVVDSRAALAAKLSPLVAEAAEYCHPRSRSIPKIGFPMSYLIQVGLLQAYAAPAKEEAKEPKALQMSSLPTNQEQLESKRQTMVSK